MAGAACSAQGAPGAAAGTAAAALSLFGSLWKIGNISL